jgi:hypothetical protein
MESMRIFRHEGYDLRCAARRVDGGRFAPELIVCKQVWPTRPRVIALEAGSYASEATAIDAAYAQGVEWIVNYG